MDVSALAGLHTLKLVRCGNVRNVSALAGCAPLHTLDLTLCLGVTDVGMRGVAHARPRVLLRTAGGMRGAAVHTPPRTLRENDGPRIGSAVLASFSRVD